MFALLIGVGALLPSSAKASDASDVTTNFYSFVPAAPRLGTPSLVPPVWADDREKARTAYQSGDFSKALTFLEDAADDGDLIATWYLGHMYRLGQGVKANDAKAFAYYQQVASAFDPDGADRQLLRVTIDALVRVGDYLRTGQTRAEIAADPQQAFNLYKVASTYGHPAAQYALGLMYFEGIGIKRNRDQAVRWLMLAARKRFAPAEALLGEMYWKGDYVHQDKVRGLMWYILARQSAQPEENPEIFDRYDHLMGEASATEQADAQGRALDWAAKFPSQVQSASP
ncbi:hypothetical protein FHS85_004334 [Rhodoligotrophos appendicifer]|uniref:tetratricopeptide repeat protein n=1 Tax=Rhodoligotrophos appendicifer TaxID=987056 RepID=UPI001479589E|nr:tetratricopeptide repeat protein [Rhodoligotrophos appendicifer]